MKQKPKINYTKSENAEVFFGYLKTVIFNLAHFCMYRFIYIHDLNEKIFCNFFKNDDSQAFLKIYFCFQNFMLLTSTKIDIFCRGDWEYV